MKCELIKIKKEYKDKKGKERFFYLYYLVFENGVKQRIEPCVYTFKDKVHDNRDTLYVLAREVDMFENIEYGK